MEKVGTTSQSDYELAEVEIACFPARTKHYMYHTHTLSTMTLSAIQLKDGAAEGVCVCYVNWMPRNTAELRDISAGVKNQLIGQEGDPT